MTDREKTDHWASLASDLGAEVSAQPITPTGSPDVSQTEAPPRARLSEARRPKPHKPAVEPQRPAANWDQLANALGVAVPAEPATVETVPLPKPAKPAATQVVVLAGASDLLEQPADLGGEDTDATQESDSASGVGGATAETEERKSLRRRRKRRRKPRGSREGEAPEDEPRPSRASVIGTQVRASAATDAEAEAAADQTLAVSEAKHSERRRSRYGARKRQRGPDREEAAAEQPALAEPDEELIAPEEDASDEAPASTQRRREAEAEDRPGRSRSAEDDKAAHRAIPTWEDAIGMIVAANLEARAKRPSGGQPRGRNGGRRPREQRGPGKKSTDQADRGS